MHFIRKIRVLIYSKVYQSIISKPVYGTNAFGMRIPSGVWKSSNRAATILGSAKDRMEFIFDMSFSKTNDKTRMSMHPDIKELRVS